MAILKIARMGHPVLRQKARQLHPKEIGTPAIQRLVDDMLRTMHEYQGIGLAAPQVHEDLRLYLAMVVDDEDSPDTREVVALFNPEISLTKGDAVDDWEGCLSIPGVQGLVPRAREVSVTALDREGQRVDFTARDLSARVIQHEHDHIDGVLFIDRMRDCRSLAFVRESERHAPVF